MSSPFIYAVKKCVSTPTTTPRLTSPSYHRCWSLRITREKYQHLSQSSLVWMSPECLVKAKVTREKYFFIELRMIHQFLWSLLNISKYFLNNIFNISAPDSSPTFPMTESPPPGYITDDGDGVSSPGSNVSSSGEQSFRNINHFSNQNIMNPPHGPEICQN